LSALLYQRAGDGDGDLRLVGLRLGKRAVFGSPDASQVQNRAGI
jgi:hypothetical protein